MSTVLQQTNSYNHKSNVDYRQINRRRAESHRPARELDGVFTDDGGGKWLAFNSRGKLPYGVHTLTWGEFVKRFAYNSERKHLLRGLVRAIFLLRRAGCRTIYIGGSYVTTKQRPVDIDCVWESRGMDWERVKKVAPVFLKAKTGHEEQMEQFCGEFFPSQCGEKSTGLPWLDFFQKERAKGRRRGVVRIEINF